MLGKHWQRLKRSLSRRFKEFVLPRGYRRLGSRYGGWWLDSRRLAAAPLLIDCGLGKDISFPVSFLDQFGGRVVGVEPNPHSLEYCKNVAPKGMRIIPQAFWIETGNTLTFHLPRPQEELPKGADGVSGSILDSHTYVGDESISVETISFAEILKQEQRQECDVLKMDIEGAEYEILEALCNSGEIALAKQLLVEFHHGATSYTQADTERIVSMLEARDFRLIHTEGRNYIFCRIV